MKTNNNTITNLRVGLQKDGYLGFAYCVHYRQVHIISQYQEMLETLNKEHEHDPKIILSIF